MPPRYLRKGTTKLKPCSEFTVEACDIAPADQCCGALPCTLCLELEIYGEPTTYGTATFGGSSWTGTVGGLAFVSYWERDAYGECEYVVTLDGEEVYRATCYDGASCRDPGGSVGVTIGYDEGTLTWTKHEPRPLALTTDPDTGCNDFFCGTCRCSCDCLCVTIIDGYDATTTTGEICDVSYPCDAPVWSGTVGDYVLSVALGRDSYGECIITLTADGEEQDAVAVTGCADMSASVTLYDGTIIFVRCKQCSCESSGPEETCCGPDRCLPDQTCDNPLPSSLRINVSGTFSGGACTCLELDSTLTFYGIADFNPHTGAPNVWAGTFTNCGVYYRYSLACVSDELGWRLTYLTGDGNGNFGGTCLNSVVFHPSGILMEKASCSPVVLSGEFLTSGIGCCNGSHLVGIATLSIVIWG
jgi:hypothetical protein